MSDLSFERSRQDENVAKFIYLHNFSKSKVEISWIKGLNLTSSFSETNYFNLIIGLRIAYYISRFVENCFAAKVYIFGHLFITTYLVSYR